MLIAIAVIIVILAFLMEIAAIALKMTGLDINTSRFQALSALTGTGFTTREAETVLANPIRRRIIMLLMIIGNAGLVTIIITAISSLQRQLAWYQVVFALVLLLVLFRFISNRVLLRNLDQRIEKTISRQTLLRRRPVEEVLKLDDNFGVVEVTVDEDCHLVNKKLGDTDLSKNDLLVLAIQRGKRINHAPRAADYIQAGDHLIIYGDIQNLDKCFLNQ